LFCEVGSGYYTKLGVNGRFDVYGGYGMGTAESRYMENGPYYLRSYSSGRFSRIFIQPGIGYTNNIYTSSFALRISRVNFYDLRKDPIMDAEAEKSTFFFELVFTSKIGYKWIKYMIQFGVSIPTSRNLAFEHEFIIFNTGLSFDIRDFTKTEKNPENK
jgi:hypothetical protein